MKIVGIAGTVSQHIGQLRANGVNSYAKALFLFTAISSQENPVSYTLFIFQTFLFLMKNQDKCADVQPVIRNKFQGTDSIFENPLTFITVEVLVSHLNSKITII